jgi:hypothetical protein
MKSPGLGRPGGYFRPCIAMNAAHVRAEAAITTRNGFTVDLADFAIELSSRWYS